MPSSTPKPENKPVGSVNVVVAPDFEGDGFWMAEEETLDDDLTCLVGAEPDLLLGTSDNTDSTQHSEEEGDLDLEPECHRAACRGAREPLMTCEGRV
jgi:hypothetical protein